MTVSYVKGDVFDQEVDAYAHGCNCQGVQGAGIAKQFRERFPMVYRTYKSLCDAGAFLPGQVYVAGTESGKVVYSLATQLEPGPHANLEAVYHSLLYMEYHARTLFPLKSIAVPLIGCGIGGLDWADVRKVMELVFDESPVELVVCSLT